MNSVVEFLLIAVGAGGALRILAWRMRGRPWWQLVLAWLAVAPLVVVGVPWLARLATRGM